MNHQPRKGEAMIRILLTILAVITLAGVSFGQTKTVTVSWDQDATQNINDLESIRIYNIVPATPVLLATAACTGITPSVVCPTSVQITVTLGTQYQIVARNYDGIQESANSNTVTTPGKPPKNLRR
jgi:hypothetical protein